MFHVWSVPVAGAAWLNRLGQTWLFVHVAVANSHLKRWWRKMARRSRRLYGPLRGPKDVIRINRKIRSQIRRAKSRSRIIELQKRSQYLYTLTFSPSVKKGLKGKVQATRRRALIEFRKTQKLAHQKLGR